MMKRIFILLLLVSITLIIIGYNGTITLLKNKATKLFAVCTQNNRTTNIVSNNQVCYENYFKNIVLVIVFNYPQYDSIPLLQQFYKPVFPNIFFCGPQSNISHSLVHAVDIRRGIFGYECLAEAIRQNHDNQGYFYINDDVILNYWNLFDSQWNSELIWESNNKYGQVDVDQDIPTNWYWWISPYGFKNARKAVEEIKMLSTSYKAYKVCYDMFLENGENKRYLHNGRSDVVYIPRKYSLKFQELSRIFHKHQVFLEIAIPTMLRFLANSSHIKTLNGHYIPGDVRKNDPRVIDSRYFWTLYLKKPDLWFIHPFKLHHKQNKNRELNIALLKQILITKTKELTKC